MSDRFRPGPPDTTDAISPSSDGNDAPTSDEDVQPGTEFGVAGQNTQAHEEAWGPAANAIDELAFPDRTTAPDAQDRTGGDDSDDEADASSVRSASQARDGHSAWIWRLIWWTLPLGFLGAAAIGYAAITGFTTLSQGLTIKLATGLLLVIGTLGVLAYLTTGQTTD